jgi:hypothetical protein
MLIIMIISYSFVLPPWLSINCNRYNEQPDAKTTCCSDKKVKCCRLCTDSSGHIQLTRFNCKKKIKKKPSFCCSFFCCSNDEIKCCKCCVTKKGICNISGRDSCYNSFYYTHHLLWSIFLICFVTHGMGEWLEPSLTWLWVIVPFTIYLYERIWRICNPNRHSKIVDAKIINQGRVVCLVLERTKSLKNFLPGMYVSIKIPELSKYQWHPFSISSAPSWEDEKHFTLHIQGLGDWTKYVITVISLFFLSPSSS